jgi:hypothetical protein
MVHPTTLRTARLWRFLGLALVVASSLGVAIHPVARPGPGAAEQIAGRIPAAEFSRLVQEMSEEEGYFGSDNFTSNETAYPFAVARLRKLNVNGGAYLGVGPEQNFNYIAKLRPKIAFIMDIRRQAIIQHLLYKAIFRMAPTAPEFLSYLVCRPLPAKKVSSRGAPFEDVVTFLEHAEAPEATYSANMSRVRDIIRKEFGIPLSDGDLERLDYVYSAFQSAGLGISFRFGPRSFGGYGNFPTLKDLILQRDGTGNFASFLANREDYAFVRDLHEQNRIIPLVGDFAGNKALAGVGAYLRKHGYTLKVLYASNVERYLFRNDVFPSFVSNVRRLPIDQTSVLIRSVSQRGQFHPAYIPGHRSTIVLQRIALFLKDHDDGAHTSYWNMVTSNFIDTRD